MLKRVPCVGMSFAFDPGGARISAGSDVLDMSEQKRVNAMRA